MSALNERSTDPELPPESREVIVSIAEKATKMTEAIKHAIVLLQVSQINQLCFEADLSLIQKTLNTCANQGQIS